MKKLDSLFSSRGFRVVALSCGTVFLIVAAIFLFLFFRSGGFDILFAKATDFEMVMSENEHVFDKVGDKFVLLAYTEPDDGLEIGFSSTNEEIVNVTSDGTLSAETRAMSPKFPKPNSIPTASFRGITFLSITK